MIELCSKGTVRPDQVPVRQVIVCNARTIWLWKEVEQRLSGSINTILRNYVSRKSGSAYICACAAVTALYGGIRIIDQIAELRKIPLSHEHCGHIIGFRL